MNAAIKDNNCLVINAVPRLSSLIPRGQISNAFLKLDMTKMADCKNFMVNLWYGHTQNRWTFTTVFFIEIFFVI